MTDLLDYCVEAVYWISRVLDHSNCAVGLVQAVRTLDNVTVALLVLLLNVTGVGVVNSIVEGVLWISLRKNNSIILFL